MDEFHDRERELRRQLEERWRWEELERALRERAVAEALPGDGRG